LALPPPSVTIFSRVEPLRHPPDAVAIERVFREEYGRSVATGGRIWTRHLAHGCARQPGSRYRAGGRRPALSISISNTVPAPTIWISNRVSI
jgi:hypothetical protein